MEKRNTHELSERGYSIEIKLSQAVRFVAEIKAKLNACREPNEGSAENLLTVSFFLNPGAPQSYVQLKRICARTNIQKVRNFSLTIKGRAFLLGVAIRSDMKPAENSARQR